jgi:protein-serine/threonine kinase
MNGAAGGDEKLNMGGEMRRIMEEEKRKIQQQQEARERQRRMEADRERREFEEYQASMPKKSGGIAQQELGGGGYGGVPDRYTPGRAAPSAPSDRSRQQAPRPQESSRQPPRAPYAQQSGSSSREQSPAPQGRPDQRQPGSRPADRNQSPSTRSPNGTAGQTRAPGGQQQQQQTKPLNVNKPSAPDAQRKQEERMKEGGGEAKGGEKKKEVRMSSMSESEVMARLRKIVTKHDPNETYSKQKKIGQGASGSVYIAKVRSDASSPVGKSLYRRDGSEARVAIKTMDLKHQPRKELIVNEIIVMKESVHPNIVNYLDSFLIENDSELWVIMEYMNGGALTDVIENNPVISEDQIAAICNEVSIELLFPTNTANPITQTCKGLAHLHTQEIIHRDIKSDNVLLDSQGRVKISTFPSPTPFSPRTNQPCSRLRVLREADARQIEAGHDGGDAILDGARGGEAKGVRAESGHLVAGDHGD